MSKYSDQRREQRQVMKEEFKLFKMAMWFAIAVLIIYWSTK